MIDEAPGLMLPPEPEQHLAMNLCQTNIWVKTHNVDTAQNYSLRWIYLMEQQTTNLQLKINIFVQRLYLGLKGK